MFKEAFVLFLLLIVGDRIGSLTGTPTPVLEITRAEQDQIAIQLKNLREAVQNMSERFKEQLDRIENRLSFTSEARKMPVMRPIWEMRPITAAEESGTGFFGSEEPRKFTMPPFIRPDFIAHTLDMMPNEAPKKAVASEEPRKFTMGIPYFRG